MLLDTKQNVIESKIIDHITYLKDVQKLSYLSIQVHLSGIFHFFEMNDYNLNTKKIKWFLPEDITDHYGMDSPYSVKEIDQILAKCDVRDRVVILLMASAGMRIGALLGLLIGDLKKIEEFGLYLIWVYNRSRNDRYKGAYFFKYFSDYSIITIMLFVGAGASKPFGAPVLSELTRQVRSIFDERGYGDLWGHVYDSLKQKSAYPDDYFISDDEIDMEVMLSIIDFIIDPNEKIKEQGPLLYYSSKNLTEPFRDEMPSKKEYSNIRNKIENKIVRSCNNINFPLAKGYYGKLFRLEQELHRKYLNANGDGSTTLPFEYAVTTNYDLLLERYAFESDHDNLLPGDSRLPSKDFFRRGFKRERNEAVDMYLQLGQTNSDLRYLKLHGSIDWWRDGSPDGSITARESHVSLFGKKYPKRVMIYPAYEKKVSREPFASLHTHFRNILLSDEVYVVIGYSFRDSEINDSFLDALKDDKKKRMIIVNPSKEKIRPKLRDFPLERIDMIQQYFGRSELFNELEAVLTRKPQGFES